MKPTALARKAVLVEVALLRPPLQFADRVAARLGAGAAARAPVRRSLAVLDAVDIRLAGRSRRVAPSPGAGPTDPSRNERVEQVAEELLEEQELAPLAGELADNEELRRVQAELNAKRLLDEQHPRTGQEKTPPGSETQG